MMATCITVAVIVNVIIMRTPDNRGYFYETKSQDDQLISYMSDEEVSSTYGDYTITMTNSIYDSTTYKGYCIFTVECEGHNMKNEYYSDWYYDEDIYYQGNSEAFFGENLRFRFYTNDQMTFFKTEVKTTKDVMTIYVQFQPISYSEEYEFDGNIYVIDFGNGLVLDNSVTDEMIGDSTCFPIKSNTVKKVLKAENSDSQLVVTPFSFCLINDEGFGYNLGSLYMNDGIVINLKDTEKICCNYNGIILKYYEFCGCFTDYIIDLENVDYAEAGDLIYRAE